MRVQWFFWGGIFVVFEASRDDWVDVVVSMWLQSQESSFGPVCCEGSGPRLVKLGLSTRFCTLQSPVVNIMIFPVTLPETNTFLENRPFAPKGNLIFQPSISRGKMLVLGRVSPLYISAGLKSIRCGWMECNCWALLISFCLFKFCFVTFDHSKYSKSPLNHHLGNSCFPTIYIKQIYISVNIQPGFRVRWIYDSHEWNSTQQAMSQKTPRQLPASSKLLEACRTYRRNVVWV